MVKSVATPVTNPIVGTRAPEVAPAEVQPAAVALSPEVKSLVDAAVAKYTAAMSKRTDMTPESKARAIAKYTARMISQMPGMLNTAA